MSSVEAIPMERVLGPELGAFIRALHEQHGVTFHLGHDRDRDRRSGRDARQRRASRSDLVVVGIGVRPRLRWPSKPGSRSIAEWSSINISRPARRASSRRATSRAGPIRTAARRIRVEHFVVAERQGQTAARNMLGRREPFDAVPFFWTEQYGVGIAYVGHAEQWDEMVIDGSIEERNCSISYRRDGRAASRGGDAS